MASPFKINLDARDIYACGRVAVWSAMLDTVMEAAIWHLLDLPASKARKMTRGTQANRKREILAMLVEAKTLPALQRAELRSILAEIEKALIDRNLVIHGLWHIGPDNKPWVAKYNERGNLTFHDQMNYPLVQPVAETAKALATRLANWLIERDPAALTSAFPEISSRTKPVRRQR